MKKIICSLLCIAATILSAQEKRPAYPLYAHFWVSGVDYNDSAVLTKITSSFDYIVGNTRFLPSGENLVSSMYSLNPNFQIIPYQGGWSVNANQYSGSLMDLLYYKSGELANPIDENKTTIDILSGGIRDFEQEFVASSIGRYDTWIRINNELLKIISVSSHSRNTLRLEVSRGYNNTIPRSYSAGEVITAPLYEVSPKRASSANNISYIVPVFGERGVTISNNLQSFHRSDNYNGVWIDIVIGQLGAQTMNGKRNFKLWDYRTNTSFNNSSYIQYTKETIASMKNEYKQLFGEYPYIYGNNVLFSTDWNSGARGFLMVPDNNEQPVINGMCQEDTWGHMTDKEQENEKSSGIVTINGTNNHILQWFVEDKWVANCKGVAFLSQKSLPNQPMTINAGFKNQWFASDLTESICYSFNKFAYASYLLCIQVNDMGKTTTRMGISALRVKDGQTKVVIEDFFYYPIGIPQQNEPWQNFTNYQLSGYSVFARRFSNGIVIVNPYNSDMQESISVNQLIPGMSQLYDPETQSMQSSIILPKLGAKILLINKDL